MTKVINIFGAPGSGKSTLAFGLAYHLKLNGVNYSKFILNYTDS